MMKADYIVRANKYFFTTQNIPKNDEFSRIDI